jgi:hypothetical protein
MIHDQYTHLPNLSKNQKWKLRHPKYHYALSRSQKKRHRQRSLEYYWENRELILLKARIYDKRNRERDREKNRLKHRLYCANNRAYIRRLHRMSYHNNIDTVRARNREYYQSLRLNPEKYKRKLRIQSLNQKNKVRVLKDSYVKHLLKVQDPNRPINPKMIRNYKVILLNHRKIKEQSHVKAA